MAEMKQIRILLAEDIPSISYALSVFMKNQAGWVLVGTVRRASELFERITEMLPDVIVVDVDLPKLALEELCKRTGSTNTRPAIIAICRSPELKTQFLAAGANYVVSKVDPPDSLTTAVLESQGNSVP
jgi:DNA-binding NarL/FixJ family response regulator